MTTNFPGPPATAKVAEGVTMTAPDISLGSWFAARAIRSAGRRALTFEEKTWTYGQLIERVDRLAAGFRELGVCHGDRIGYLGTNHPALLETMLAASRLGAIFVPLNFRLTGRELSVIARDAGLHTLVADGVHQPVIDGVRDQLPVHRYVGVEGAGAGWQAFESIVDRSSRLPCPDSVTADEVAVLMYTSGTTGQPKGVMLTHANLWWNNTNLMHLYDVLADDVTLVASPLFHIAGLNVTIPTTWRRGGEVVLHRAFDPQAALDDISRYRITTPVRGAGHVPGHQPAPGLRGRGPEQRADGHLWRRPGPRSTDQAVPEARHLHAERLWADRDGALSGVSHR